MFFSLLFCISCIQSQPSVWDYTAMTYKETNITQYSLTSEATEGTNYHMIIACTPSDLYPLNISVGVVSDNPVSLLHYRFSSEDQIMLAYTNQHTFRLDFTGYCNNTGNCHSDTKEFLQTLLQHDDALIVQTNEVSSYPLSGLTDSILLFPKICQPSFWTF